MRVQAQTNFIDFGTFNFIYQNFKNVALTDTNTNDIMIRFDTNLRCITPEQISIIYENFYNVTFCSNGELETALNLLNSVEDELNIEDIEEVYMEEEEEEEINIEETIIRYRVYGYINATWYECMEVSMEKAIEECELRLGNKDRNSENWLNVKKVYLVHNDIYYHNY